MIEFGKITGELDGNLYELQLIRGECIFAPLIVTSVGASVPSEDWVKANKDNFLALVSYESENPNKPFIIGFYPTKSAKSNEYNILERLLDMNLKLVEQLLKAKTNTQIGPQPFMPDTIQVFNEVKDELDEIKKLILKVGE